MDKPLQVRLSLMMFMQFFVWGAWYATVGNYMTNVGMSDAIFWAYTVSPIGAIISPFFLGMVADRFFAPNRVMAVMHLLSGAFILCAPFVAEGEVVSTPLFISILLLHMLCYMPTLGLANAVAFHNMTDRENEFPQIRVFGTIGWIVAGVLVSYVLQADETAIPLYIAGIAGMMTGAYCFTLPHVPPPAAGEKISLREVLGLDALAHLKSRSFIVFMGCLLLTSIPLATYYAYAPVFINAAEVSDPAFKMSFGQMSEVIFLLMMPMIITRIGVKWVLLAGMMAWVARYGLFALAAPSGIVWMIIVGILLHGICYDFVYIAGQIYVDQKSNAAIRGQAQGLFVIVTYGVGQGVGALLAGWVFNNIVTGNVEQALGQWQTFWIIPVVFALIVAIAFALLFEEEEEVVSAKVT